HHTRMTAKSPTKTTTSRLRTLSMGLFMKGALATLQRSGQPGKHGPGRCMIRPAMGYIAGRSALLHILKQGGVSVMFRKPSTPELPFMVALAREPGIRDVLALQEVVAVCMADGYAQASGGIGAVNVHVSPGLGNAMGMLYDAYKAGAPLLLPAGQHDQSFTVT